MLVIAYYRPGGLLGRTEKGERVLIFLGIIDILQSYRYPMLILYCSVITMLVARLRKKLEHTLKSVFTDGVRYLANKMCLIIMLLHTGHCISA